MSRYLNKNVNRIEGWDWNNHVNGYEEYSINLLYYYLNKKKEFINARTCRAKDKRRDQKWEKMIEEAMNELNIN